MLDYKIKNQYSNIRRDNRKDFVESIKGSKIKNIAILSIHFNNFDNTKSLLDYLAKESNQNFDIILIENSTKKDEENKLLEYCSGKENISIIKPINNLGSAGGYALGMEYIIDQKYKYFFIVEDDVVFLEENIFSDMIKYSNKETLTFINGCKNCRSSKDTKNKLQSRWVQIAGYPVNFLEKIGIIDPRYFFRGEDLEWGGRILKGIKNIGYKTQIIDHNYIHPYLKSVNGNYTWFYFSIRNQLFSLEKHPIRDCKFFIPLFLYLRTALTKLILNKDILILKSLIDAILDFLKHNFSFQNNKHRITLFLKNTIDKERYTWVNNQKLSKISKKFYSNKILLCLTGTDRERLSFSNNIGNIWRYGILISSSSTVFYPVVILAYKVICINEFNLTDKKIAISQYKNGNRIMNLIGIIVGFIASVGLIIIVNFIIILSIGFNKCLKK